MTARAITAPELVKLRKDNQFSRLYLAIHKPAIVFQARINQAFTSLDMVTQITFDNVTTGAYTDILQGMTLWIGTSAGARDLGRVRVRKAATSTVIYIGETADVEFADNAYLTVVDEFGLWARHLRIDSSSNVYMDWDIAYSVQHASFAPVPVMGPSAVIWLTGASVTTSFNAYASWCLSSGTISYSWSFPGAASTNNTSTANPSATYNAPGIYRVSLTVTCNTRTGTGYRYIYVYSAASMPVTQFSLDSLSGDYERGGWEFSVTLFDEASIEDVQDGAQVILFAKDYYGGTQESLGPVTGRENIIASGWIDGESIEVNPVAGRAKFSVQGPQAWIEKMSGFPVGFENTATTPAAWTEIQTLTVDKALFSFLFYRSTVPYVTDVILTGDTRQAAAIEAPQGSLWSQITTIAEETIFARPCCNRYGQMWVQINQQYIPEADRGTIPTVMTLTKKDWRDALNIEYAPIPSIARVELSGIAMLSNTPQAYFSLANGHTPRRYGSILVKDRILLASQAQANTLTSLVMSANDLEWDFSIQGAANNRFVDIAPQQYIDVDILPADSPRGVGYDDLAIVRSVSGNFQPGANTLFFDWQAESVSHEKISANGDIPIYDTDGNLDFEITLPPFPAPPLPTIPPLPVIGNAPRFVFVLTSVGLFYTETFDADAPTWVSLSAGFESRDSTDLFRFLDVNQDGRYYVGTRQQIYTGAAGSSAFLLRSYAQLLSELPLLPPYYVPYLIYGLGCNPAASDDYAFVAGYSYPESRGYLFNAAGKEELTRYAEVEKGSVSWGPGGILLTYPTGLGQNGGVARFSFDGGTEDYEASLGGTTLTFAHIRSIDGADRVLTIVSNGSSKKSQFLVNNGETVESETARPLNAGAFDTSALKIMAVDGTTAYTSDDGGATWTAIVAFPKNTANNSYIQCIATDAYVWATRGNPTLEPPGVYFTEDFGTSFLDKTGNLLSLAGNGFSIAGLKAFL